jgi:hypothetical protein
VPPPPPPLPSPPITSTAAVASSAGPKQKRIRWFVGNSANFGCLLSAQNYSDITDGVIQCCNGVGFNASGGWIGSPADDSFFAQFREAGKPVWATVQAYAGQAEAPGLCTEMVGRKETIAKQMVATALNAKLHGYNVDWETGSNNSVACFVELWSWVGAALRQHGIQLNTDIDQSCLKLSGFPGPDCGPTQWSYLWNFDTMITAFDSFTEMATVS